MMAQPYLRIIRTCSLYCGVSYCCTYEPRALFFFKQKTAYELRISDWSSDVCSSDLPEILFRAERDLPPREEAYSYEEVASAVVAVPAFEFLATRYSANFTSLLGQKDPQIYADNTLSDGFVVGDAKPHWRSTEEHKSELQYIMRITYDHLRLQKQSNKEELQ